MNIKYGYPTKFNIGLPRLLSEIKFAKKYFDFTEITLELDPEHLDLLLGYTSQDILRIKKALGDFKAVSHFDWDVNPFNYIKKIGDIVKVLKKLGIQQLTVHPYEKSGESSQNILDLLLKINQVCEKNKILLCIENNSSGIFSKASNFARLMNNISNVGITWDIGHTNKISELEFDLFLKKMGPRIKHMHLHDNIGQIDHLFFKNKLKLKKILSKINSIDYHRTITLETIHILKNSKKIYLSVSLYKNERRKSFTNQLKMIKSIKF